MNGRIQFVCSLFLTAERVFLQSSEHPGEITEMIGNQDKKHKPEVQRTFAEAAEEDVRKTCLQVTQVVQKGRWSERKRWKD